MTLLVVVSACVPTDDGINDERMRHCAYGGLSINAIGGDDGVDHSSVPAWARFVGRLSHRFHYVILRLGTTFVSREIYFRINLMWRIALGDSFGKLATIRFFTLIFNSKQNDVDHWKAEGLSSVFG